MKNDNIVRNSRGLRAVIFDVDGTLVDSNDLHVQAWQESFSRFDKELSFDELHQQIGKGADQLMPVFCSEEELERFGPQLEEHRTQLFKDKYLERVTPFPGVRELFEHLKQDGMLIAVASSANEAEVEEYIEKLGIASMVDAAVSADDADRTKPAPDIFKAALEKLERVTAREAVVIGDTPWDAKAAAKAGMSTIGVLSGGFSEDVLREAGVMLIFRDATDLLERYVDWLIPEEQSLAAGR